MKHSGLFLFSFVLLVGNFGQIKPMEDDYKEPAELFERRAIDEIIEQQKSDGQNSYSVFKIFLKKIKIDTRFDETDIDKQPPKFFDVQSQYVSKDSADILLGLKAKYIKSAVRENKDGTSTLTPSRMVIDMNEYDSNLITTYRVKDPSYNHIVQPLIVYANGQYVRGFLHGALVTGATAGLGYGAWWYFNRNK